LDGIKRHLKVEVIFLYLETNYNLTGVQLIDAESCGNEIQELGDFFVRTCLQEAKHDSLALLGPRFSLCMSDSGAHLTEYEPEDDGEHLGSVFSSDRAVLREETEGV